MTAAAQTLSPSGGNQNKQSICVFLVFSKSADALPLGGNGKHTTGKPLMLILNDLLTLVFMELSLLSKRQL